MFLRAGRGSFSNRFKRVLESELGRFFMLSQVGFFIVMKDVFVTKNQSSLSHTSGNPKFYYFYNYFF